jgi:hypothetical protein
VERRPFCHSFSIFYRENVNPDADIRQDRDGLAQFVASVMLNKLMYKGTEDPQNVSDLHTNSDRVLGY